MSGLVHMHVQACGFYYFSAGGTACVQMPLLKLKMTCPPCFISHYHPTLSHHGLPTVTPFTLWPAHLPPPNMAAPPCSAHHGLPAVLLPFPSWPHACISCCWKRA